MEQNFSNELVHRLSHLTRGDSLVNLRITVSGITLFITISAVGKLICIMELIISQKTPFLRAWIENNFDLSPNDFYNSVSFIQNNYLIAMQLQ